MVISFVAPAVFWEQCIGYMYKWSHPNRLFCRALMVFSVVIAGLSLPGLLVSMVGDLYATAWWVPIASSSGMQSWSGGISLEAMADTVVSGEVVTTYDALRAVPPPPPPALHGHVERKKTRSVLGGFQQAPKARVRDHLEEGGGAEDEPKRWQRGGAAGAAAAAAGEDRGPRGHTIR